MGIAGGFLLLAPFVLCGKVVELFGPTGVIDTQTARFVVIPLDNICSLEVMSIPVPMINVLRDEK